MYPASSDYVSSICVKDVSPSAGIVIYKHMALDTLLYDHIYGKKNTLIASRPAEELLHGFLVS